ncbi:DUF3990 domain-containing protein [Breznakiellaceae bacterium SP9]
METKMILYHGSNRAFALVDLSKSKNRRDFGKGFYMTTLKSQAEQWAKRMFDRLGGGGIFVYEFELSITDDLKFRQFERLNQEWLEFVVENRTKGGTHHGFDVVQGPVANDDTRETIAYYLVGIYSAEEALNRLRYMKPNDQVSIHSDKARDCLHW